MNDFHTQTSPWRRLRLVSLLGTLFIALLIALVSPAVALSQEEDETAETETIRVPIEREPEVSDFAATIDGRQTWTISYGFGSPVGLAGRGISAGSFSIDQSLSVDLVAEALSILRVEGHFDPQLDDALQSLTVYLDTDHWDGVLGDFTVGSVSGFSTHRRKTMGAQLEYSFDAFSATGVVARLEGITESRVFVGKTAADETTYSALRPDDPLELQPYARHIDGLFSYALLDRYVEELSDVDLIIPEDASLGSILSAYGLSYLDPQAPELHELRLESASFVVLGDEDQTLLLRQEPKRLIRSLIEDAISAYNSDIGATSGERKKYPFVRDSDYETEFLGEIAALAALRIDGLTYALSDGVRRTFYDLGHRPIIDETAAVEVSLDGGPFTPITRPEFADYSFVIHREAGVIEIDFPQAFFDASDASFRVAYSYGIAGGAYMLGLSIVPGTERVTLNGVLLDSNVYEMEYEIGMLILLQEVSDEDIIEVEYERFGSGLGGTSDYARYIYGLTLSQPVSDVLDLTATIQAGIDRAGSVEEPERVDTMPNRQVVGGILGELDLGDFRSSFSLGYGQDVFPIGASDRPEAPNEVTSIDGNGEFLFVGTRNGLAVQHDGVWRTYDTGDGLSGRWIREVIATPDAAYFATNAGLTVVQLSGTAPMDRVESWARYGEVHGLTSPSVLSLALDEELLWLGTTAGLFVVPIDSLDDPMAWEARPDIESGEITALAAQNGVLYLGTIGGAFAMDLVSEVAEPLDGTQGQTVHEFRQAASGDQLLISTNQGLLLLDRTGLIDVVVTGKDVSSAASYGEAIYYIADESLGRISDDQILHEEWAFTALGTTSGGELWAGSRADAAYEIPIWQIEPATAMVRSVVSGIDGRDPSRYMLISAGDFTNEGLFARARFELDEDALQMDGDFAAIAPGYRAIGETARLGTTEWSLRAVLDPLDFLTVTADHEYERRLLENDEPYIRGGNGFELDSNFGPELDLLPDVTLSVRNDTTNSDPGRTGVEARASSYKLRLADEFLSELVDASLTWSRSVDWDYRDEFTMESHIVTAAASMRPFDTLSLSGSFRRPLRSSNGEWSGREQLDLDGEWTPNLQSASLTVNAAVDLTRRIGRQEIEQVYAVEGDLRINSFNTSGWSLTPTLNGSLELDEGITQVYGRGLLRTRRDVVTLTTTLSAELSGIGSNVLREEQRLSLSFNHTGEPSWIPTATYTLTRSATSRTSGDRAVSFNHSLNVRSDWKTQTASNRASLMLGLRSEGEELRLTGHVEDEYRRDLADLLSLWIATPASEVSDARPAIAEYPSAQIVVGFDADFRLDEDSTDADGSLSAGLSVSITEMWSASFSAIYLAGLTSTGSAYGSYLLELTLGVDFQLTAP